MTSTLQADNDSYIAIKEAASTDKDSEESSSGISSVTDFDSTSTEKFNKPMKCASITEKFLEYLIEERESRKRRRVENRSDTTSDFSITEMEMKEEIIKLKGQIGQLESRLESKEAEMKTLTDLKDTEINMLKDMIERYKAMYDEREKHWREREEFFNKRNDDNV